MAKKVIFLIVVLILFGGGFFYWQNQADVRELNKNLPEGVKVEKSLFGDEYKVVNKIDGYEFAVPEEWKGVGEMEYIPEENEQGYIASSIGLEGKEGHSRIIGIDRFKISEDINNLEIWAQDNFDTFGLVGDFAEDKIGQFEVIKTQESVHLLGMYVYFFQKNSAIYAITNPSEDFIRDIISNGKW